MPYDLLDIRRDGPVEHVTLHRPDVRNAFNAQMLAELTHWAAGVTQDAGVRVAVLRGAGRSFCAGADLAWMSEMVAYSHEENLRDASAAAQMFLALDRLPIPLIGCVHGAALGGGAGLVALCDIVVADEETTFGFTEVKIGIVPALISPYVLMKIGMAATRELFLTGMRFDAARAREIGLVHRVVPAAALEDAVRGYVDELLTSGPESLASVKTLLREIWARPVAATFDPTTETIAARRVSAEGQEGMRAFLEKRKPSWIVS